MQLNLTRPMPVLLDWLPELNDPTYTDGCGLFCSTCAQFLGRLLPDMQPAPSDRPCQDCGLWTTTTRLFIDPMPTRKTDDRTCRICGGGPGNQGSCLCGHHAY